MLAHTQNDHDRPAAAHPETNELPESIGAIIELIAETGGAPKRPRARPKAMLPRVHKVVIQYYGRIPDQKPKRG